MDVERRFAELRAEGDKRVLSGVAVRYGDVGQLPWGRERIEPRAFEVRDVILNVMHDRQKPIARTGAGLELRDGDDALRMSADVVATRDGDDALELVRAGVYAGLSVEMRVTEERMQGDLRIVQRAELVGLSVVDRPVYEDSTVAAMRARFAVEARTPARRRWWR